MRRTADSIETTKAANSVQEPNAEPKGKRRMHPNSLKNLVAPWKPGDVPNPTGKNGQDLAKEIAQAIFSQNGEAIYKAYSKALFKGNAYAFDVIACRAFGKLKEKVEHSVDESLLQRLAEGRKRASNHNT